MLKPVHALVGTDLFLQLDALAELLRAAPADVQRIDVEGETAELADVLDEVRSFAMFSSRKIVVIRDADEFVSRFRESLENYVAKPTAESSLVLRLTSLPSNQRIHKAIAAIGQIHNCNAPKNPRDVTTWIMRRAKTVHNLSLGSDAAAMLFDLIGNDLGRLDSEMAKLALQTQGTVDASAIEQTVSFQREQEMFQLTDALGTGDIAEAMRRWRHLIQLDTSAEFRAVTWLCMWLEDVRTFLTRPQAFKNAWKYKQNLPKFQEIARKLGPAGAAKLINLLADIDYRSKSGFGEMADNVERFLLSVR